MAKSATTAGLLQAAAVLAAAALRPAVRFTSAHPADTQAGRLAAVAVWVTAADTPVVALHPAAVAALHPVSVVAAARRQETVAEDTPLPAAQPQGRVLAAVHPLVAVAAARDQRTDTDSASEKQGGQPAALFFLARLPILVTLDETKVIPSGAQRSRGICI
jgi:hypothetical protein